MLHPSFSLAYKHEQASPYSSANSLTVPFFPLKDIYLLVLLLLFCSYTVAHRQLSGQQSPFTSMRSMVSSSLYPFDNAQSLNASYLCHSVQTLIPRPPYFSHPYLSRSLQQRCMIPAQIRYRRIFESPCVIPLSFAVSLDKHPQLLLFPEVSDVLLMIHSVPQSHLHLYWTSP